MLASSLGTGVTGRCRHSPLPILVSAAKRPREIFECYRSSMHESAHIVKSLRLEQTEGNQVFGAFPLAP
jgi:hypothetical protein